MHHLQIFSQTCLFIILTFSFTESLILMKLSSSLIYFMNHAIKNSSPSPRSSGFSRRLPSRRIIALHFTFGPVIHPELIVCVWTVFGLHLCDFTCIFLAALASFLQRSSLLCYIMLFWLPVSWQYLCESVSGFCILFYWSNCLLSLVPHWFYCFRLTV